MSDPVLHIEGLTKRFGGITAVDNLSYTLAGGRLHAIIGPNGAGKTTLFNVISGFLPPTHGRIFFDEEEVTGTSPNRIAGRGLVRTFQLVQLFQNLTVLENVKVGRHVRTRSGLGAALMRPGWARREEAETEQRARELIEFVGLGSQADERAVFFPMASSGCSRSRARWRRSPDCCCSTSRRRASIMTRRSGWRASFVA
jgi:branched-chain amino acid transport system ATP-binding protein